MDTAHVRQQMCGTDSMCALGCTIWHGKSAGPVSASAPEAEVQTARRSCAAQQAGNECPQCGVDGILARLPGSMLAAVYNARSILHDRTWERHVQFAVQGRTRDAHQRRGS